MLSLKRPSDLALLYNQFNNTSPEKNNDSENVVNSKYYDIDQIQTLKFPNKHKSLALFHINACSLNKNFDDLDHLLKCTNKVFDIITVTETRITKQNSLTTNYAIEFAPTESSAGGTLLYIASHPSYKPRPDLNVYKANQLESTFIDGTTISNPMSISNIFNNYFSSIANKTKLNISFSHKHFSDFLKNRTNTSFFVSSTDKTKIENVISSLDSNKSVGPNSIPTKVLKLLKNDISSQLSEIFNISFSSGVFPSILKTARVIPVHKKDSQLDFSNYRPISFLSNIEKG